MPAMRRLRREHEIIERQPEQRLGLVGGPVVADGVVLRRRGGEGLMHGLGYLVADGIDMNAG